MAGKTALDLYNHRKNQTKKVTKTPTNSSGGKTALDLYNYRKQQKTQVKVPSEVEDLYNRYNALVGSATERYSQSGYHSDSKKWKDVTATATGMLSNSSKEIRGNIDNYKATYGEDFANSVLEMLDRIDKGLVSLNDAAVNDYNIFSKFADENEYNVALSTYEMQQKASILSSEERKKILKNIGKYKTVSGLRDFAEAVSPITNFFDFSSTRAKEREILGLGEFESMEEIERWESVLNAAQNDYHSNLDVSQGTSNLETLKAELEKVTANRDRVVELRGNILQKNRLNLTENKVKELEKEVKALSLDGSADADTILVSYNKRVDELKKQISGLEKDLQSAGKVQSFNALGAVMDPTSEFYNPDFEKYVQEGASRFGNVVEGVKNGKTAEELGISNDDYYRYKQMTDDEVKLYNYYNSSYYDSEYHNSKTQKTLIGDQYIDELDKSFNSLTARAAQAYYEEILKDKSGVEKVFSSVGANLERWGQNLGRAWDTYVVGSINPNHYGKEYYRGDVSQGASAIAREDLGALGKVAYDALGAASYMLPSIATSAIVGTVSKSTGAAMFANALTMGVPVAGQAYEEMINLGYSEEQAKTYGILAGASEFTTELFLNGAGKGLGKAVEPFADSIGKVMGRFAIKHGSAVSKFIAQAGSEAVEEMVQEVLDPILRTIATGDLHDGATIEEVLYSGLLGAITAGGINTFISATEGTAKAVKYYKTGKGILKSENAEAIIQRMQKLGSLYSADSVAYKLAGKVDANTGAYTIGKLFYEEGATLSSQNIADLQKSLERKGLRKEDASIIIEVFDKAVETGKLTEELGELLNGNEDISKSIVDVLINPNSTINQRRRNYSALMDEINGVSIAAAPQNEKTVSNQATNEENEVAYRNSQTEAVGANFSLSGDAVSLVSTSEEVTLGGVVTENGKNYIKIKDSSGNVQNVSADEVSFANEDEATLYTAFAHNNIDGICFDEYIKGYKESGMGSIEYASAFYAAYEYGLVGVPKSELATDPSVEGLSDYVKSVAYDFGAMAKRKQLQADIKKSKTASVSKKESVAKESQMSYTEKAALLQYKSSESYKVNAKLREGTKLDEFEQQFVENLDSALEKLPKYEGTLYRNLVFDMVSEEEYSSFLDEYAVGNLVLNKGYTSTSTTIDGYPVEGKHVVHIVIANSKNARNVSGYGNNFESEAIYPRNYAFLVENIETDSDGTPTIYLQEVENNVQRTEQGRDEGSVDGNHSREQGPSAEKRGNVLQQVFSAEDRNMQEISGRDTDRNIDTKNSMQGVSGKVNIAISAQERNRVENLCKKLGRKVVFEDTLRVDGRRSDGYVDKNGVIHIDYFCVDPVNFVLKHELAHFAERSDRYGDFFEEVVSSKAFKDWMNKQVPGDENLAVKKGKYRQQIKDRYAKKGIELSNTKLNREMLANFVGDVLFTERGSSLESIVSDLKVRKKKSFIQTIKDFITYIKQKLAGKDVPFEIIRLERMFNETLSSAGDKAGSGNEYSVSRRIKKKSYYNEFQTNAMIWSNSVTTNIGDLKILNANGKHFVLLEATEDGFIELKRGNQKEVYAEYERAYRKATVEIYGNSKGIRTEQGRDFWSLQLHGEGRDGNRDSRQTGSEELRSESRGNNENLLSGDKGKSVKEDNSYSIPAEDSQGRELTKEQSEYFKNSKVRDENGSLKVVYHGTRNADFTIFKRNINYFTDSKEMADSYSPNGDMYEGYLSIEKPYEIDAMGEKWSRIPIDTATKEFLEQYGASVFKENGKWRTTPADIASAIEEAVDNGDMDYDGIVIRNIDDTGSYYKDSGNHIATDYIVFNKNQFKNVDNSNPTTNEDIRYSLSKEGEPSSIPSEAAALLDRYEHGEISREEYIEENQRLWEKAGEEYSTIENGEFAEMRRSEASVPKKVEDDKNVKRFVRTFLETGALTKEATADVQREVLLGNFSYEPISDKSAREYADREFASGRAERVWNAAIENGFILDKTGKEQIAVGEKLLAEAIKADDRVKILELSAEISELLTRSGQVVQSARMLKQMTGIGKLVATQKNIDAINRDIQKKNKSKKDVDIKVVKLDENLAAQLATARTEEDIEAVYGDILQSVADQVPATFLDKWNAWRYTAMLANPTTHIRNFVGNTIFLPTFTLKDKVAAVIESAALPEDQRTKAVVLKRKYRDFARFDFESKDIQERLSIGGTMNPENEISERQTIFKTKWLEFLRKFNGEALAKEDFLFKSIHYRRALAGYLQARNIDIDHAIPDKVMEQARVYAMNEAIKGTFNDANQFSRMLNRFAKTHTAFDVLVNGIIPFKQTPINIVRRGVEYSPAGLLYTLSKGAMQLKKGNITAAQFIDGVSAGLVGSAIFTAGMFLTSIGWVSCGFSDDDEDKFKKLNGEQEYSIQILGKSYTIDWAAPLCIPFFMGAELMDSLSKSNDSFSLASITEPMWNMLEPVINLSMLSGIQNTIESCRYSENNKVVAAILGNVVTSYFSQGLPSVGGKLAQVIDGTKRINYTDKNSNLDSFLQSAANTIKSKIPFLYSMRPEYVDAWGRTKENDNVWGRIGQNFFSPGYYSEIDYTEVDFRLSELYDRTGDASIYPKTAPKYFTVNGERKDLSAEEYVEYAKAKGSYSFEYIQEFVSGSAYLKMDDGQRVEVITNLYRYANAKAKALVSEYDIRQDYRTLARIEEKGDSVVDYYVEKASILESQYASTDVNMAFDDGDTELALEMMDDIIKVKTENYITAGYSEKEADKKARSSVRSSMTSYWKDEYREAWKASDKDRQQEIRDILINSGLYGKRSDVLDTLKDWRKE